MIRHPSSLSPNLLEVVCLPSGKEARITKTSAIFERWRGEFAGDTYGNKPVLNVDGEPLFAELAILSTYQKDDWEGVWVDTYRGKYRTFWGDGGVTLPPDKMRLLQEIYARAGSRAGCFDVFCWKGDSLVFAESKRKAKDRIRATQLRWLEAAISSGVPLDSLLIVEWSFG
jgi:hypothetical protein